MTAQRNGLPIVALESTIITHGMPYPDNLNTALRVENAVRKQVRMKSYKFIMRDFRSLSPSLFSERVCDVRARKVRLVRMSRVIFQLQE